MIRIIFFASILSFSCCTNAPKQEGQASKIDVTQSDLDINDKEEIILSQTHRKNKITCDLDGDGFDEIVEIVRNTKSKKSGLRITFGNKGKVDILGLGEDVLGQGFDEFDWVGVFEVAPKNKKYWNNVNEDGDIITEEEQEKIKEEDKITLLNEGIYIHASESCGGGIIYLKNGKYQWIQQE